MNAVRTYGPVRSIDDLVREVSMILRVPIVQSPDGPKQPDFYTTFFVQLSKNEMTEDFKHAMIDSIVISAEDKYGHHLNKNYDWMDDYMV